METKPQHAKFPTFMNYFARVKIIAF